MRPLCLHEQALLLGLREEGSWHQSSWAINALGAALLGELVLDGALRPVAHADATYIEAVREPEIQDELVHKCYGWVVAEGDRKWTAGDWVRDFAFRPDTVPMTAQGLVRLGILKCEEKKVLWLFKQSIYPEVDPEPERKIIEHLREVLRAEGPVDARTTVLVALAHRTALLEANFSAGELSRYQERIDAIIAGNCAGDAVEDALDALDLTVALQAAVFTSVIVPAVINS